MLLESRTGLRAAAALFLLLMPGSGFAQSDPPKLDSTLQSAPFPTALFVAGAGTPRPYGAAAGDADAATHRRLTVDTPLRIASNTKTFTAAGILRLWEMGKLDLDAPVDRLISPRLNQLLRADGYATDRITVRQLLSHSAGLYDPGSDPRYIKAVLADPAHVWTREEQVRLLTEYADPQSAPATEFRYSDTGYVLLGDIIERITGERLGRSVRTLLRLDRLGLRSTWWEYDEAPPPGVGPRARQYLGTVDATDVHGSMDLYGGGGLVMSTRDLATFAAALFEGRIFDRPETLREMLWQGPHRGADSYRLGIFVKQMGDQQLYWHSGFWGTLVYYNPRTRVAVAGMTTNQDGFATMRPIVERIAAAPQPSGVLAAADAFDRAQLTKDSAAMERMVRDELVFIDGSGKRLGKKEFIAGWMAPGDKFDPITLIDRTVTPLGPDAAVVGAEVNLCGTSDGKPFCSRIRFADTFVREGSEWRVAHIQVTRLK